MKKWVLYASAIILSVLPAIIFISFPPLSVSASRPAVVLLIALPLIAGLIFIYYIARSEIPPAPPPVRSISRPPQTAPAAAQHTIEELEESVEEASISEPSPEPVFNDLVSPLSNIPPENPEWRSVDAPAPQDSELLQLCNDSPYLYCIADFDGHIIEANDAAKDLYRSAGLERGGTSWYDLLHPDDQHRTAMAVSTLIAGDTRLSSFRNRIRYDKEFRWMDWTAISKVDIRRLYIIGQDVTEYQSAYLDLSDSELRFRVAFDSMHEGMLLVDGGGRVTLINRSAERILGLSQAEAAGRRIFPSSVPLLREDGSTLTPEEHPLAKALTMGEPQDDLIFGYHNTNGELKWIEANAVPLFHQGELIPYAAVSTLSDVTESREVNEQIQTYMVTLEFQKEQLELANARLEEANHQLQTLATTDALTGLRNHRAFQERLVEEIMRAERYKTPLSLILLDVDQFKTYNDSFGHPAGDEVLRRLADILREHARTHDLAARYGGEEFILLTPHTDLVGAEVVAERCRHAIEKVQWTARPVTASFGVAALGFGIETGAELIACADHALYAAKAGGRNRVSLYAPSLGKSAQN